MADDLHSPFTGPGLPVGPVGDQAHLMLATWLLDQADLAGWDQLSTVHAVLAPGSVPLAEWGPGEALPDDGSRGSAVEFTLERVGAINGHPRHALPGLRLPDDVLEVVLVAEAWRSPDPDRATLMSVRPSQDPDRVETRTVTFVDRRGLVRGYRRDRGSDVVVEDTHEGVTMQSGRIQQLLARTIGVDVPPGLPVRAALGRYVLARCAAVAAAKALRGEEGARLVAAQALTSVGAVMDGLESPWDVQADIPNLSAVFVQGHWWGVAGDVSMADQSDASGFVRAASELAGSSWEEFWELPGAARWCYRDEAGDALTSDLWDWYGPGMRAHLLDDRLQQSSDALESLRATVGPDGYAVVGEIVSMLDLLGWDPFAESSPLDPAAA